MRPSLLSCRISYDGTRFEKISKLGIEQEVILMTIDQNAAKAITAKGKKIYEDAIKPLIDVEREKGKFVVIDVDTGDYEIDKRDIVATNRLLERRPGAMTYGVRVGFLAAYRMGGRNWLPDNDEWAS